MNRNKLLLLGLMLVAITLFFGFDLGRYLDLAWFKQQQAQIETYRAAQPWLSSAIFFVLYVSVTALSLPGAVVMTLIGGAIFGLPGGVLLVSFASTIGATLAFLFSRLLLRDSVQRRFGERLRTINQGIERDGAFYLFALRLVPIFPFFMINLLMALTPIRTWTFFWVSQLGMLAGTVVYVNAGTQLGQISHLSGILSPALIGSFVLLGVFPLLAKHLLDWIQRRKIYTPWRQQRPSHFDYNLLVIGAGAAGLVSAYIGSAVKAKVGLIERHKMGGDCLNSGCVPSKALIKSTRFIAQARRAQQLGLRSVQLEVRFSDLMQRVKRVIQQIEPHDSVERYRQLGVDCLTGEACLTSPWTVEIDGPQGKQQLSARSIIIATGARPAIPDIPGLQQIDYLTSDTVWELEVLPQRLLVLGGGPIGCELSQAFARLGAQVYLVEQASRLLPREDPEVSAQLEQSLKSDGVKVFTDTQSLAFATVQGESQLQIKQHAKRRQIDFDRVLVVTGRHANTQSCGLQTLGIELTATGTIAVNDRMQTRLPNIYACGDVAGPYQFTHMAAHTAWYASVNALFGNFRQFKVDYSVVPWAIFTEPEIARVGLNETEAHARGIAYEVTRYDLADLDRAITDEAAQGMVKVLTVPGRDKILGATLVGEHSGDLIIEFIIAMRHGLGLSKLLATPHIYPTWAEANKYVAGNWKKRHAPQQLLKWLERYHQWRRR